MNEKNKLPRWLLNTLLIVAWTVLTFVILFILFGCTPVKAESEEHIYFPSVAVPSDLNRIREEVVYYSNVERRAAGCLPLKADSRVNLAAQRHSQDMVDNDFFSHVGSDGSRFWERITATGYPYAFGGENIAAGYTNGKDVVAGWMESEGHRDNILNCSVEDVGIGFVYTEDDPGDARYKYYWTMDLATATE